MKFLKSTLVLAALTWPLASPAEDIIVTRYFTGLWDQTAYENQGINLQIVDQASGKVGVAYWFTYGADLQSAWYIGIGAVTGNRIDMTLYEVGDVGFLEPADPSSDPVEAIGTLSMVFASCSMGTVTYDTTVADIGSGSFEVERLTDLYNAECSGGVSDDTSPGVLLTEERIALAPARQGITGSGHADFEERADRTEFSVEVEDMADGSYRILVGGIDRGELVVTLGSGETEFRSPVEPGKVLLTFDPRGEVVEVHDNQGAVLTSGDAVFDDDDGGNGNDDGTDDIDFGTVDIEVELNNTGVYAAASGDAKLEPRDDRTDFSVEVEDLPVGPYTLSVGGTNVGTIQVSMLTDGSIEGELEFRNPVEPGKVLLDFDPRGQMIEVSEAGTVVLSVLFPDS